MVSAFKDNEIALVPDMVQRIYRQVMKLEMRNKVLKAKLKRKIRDMENSAAGYEDVVREHEHIERAMKALCVSFGKLKERYPEIVLKQAKPNTKLFAEKYSQAKRKLNCLTQDNNRIKAENTAKMPKNEKKDGKSNVININIKKTNKKVYKKRSSSSSNDSKSSSDSLGEFTSKKIEKKYKPKQIRPEFRDNQTSKCIHTIKTHLDTIKSVLAKSVDNTEKEKIRKPKTILKKQMRRASASDIRKHKSTKFYESPESSRKSCSSESSSKSSRSSEGKRMSKYEEYLQKIEKKRPANVPKAKQIIVKEVKPQLSDSQREYEIFRFIKEQKDKEKELQKAKKKAKRERSKTRKQTK